LQYRAISYHHLLHIPILIICYYIFENINVQLNNLKLASSPMMIYLEPLVNGGE